MSPILQMIKRFVLLMFFLRVGTVLADDCKKISKEDAFNFSDIIFLGQVFEVDDSTYKIKVIELFKGSAKDTLVGVINGNVIPPSAGSIWLIYGQKLVNDRFLADVCSGSKSMDWPHGTHDITFPTPLPPDVYKNPSQLFLLKQIIIDKALNEFYYDVTSLRARKIQEGKNLMNEEHSKMREQYSQLASELSFIKWSLIALICLSIGLIIMNLKRR